MPRLPVSIALAAAMLIAFSSVAAASQNRLLFCAYGAQDHWGPSPLIGIAVVEIRSSTNSIERVQAPSFELIDDKGRSAKADRVSGVYKLLEPWPANDSSGYYLYDTHAAPWDGTLSSETVRLRIRAVLPQSAWKIGLGRCRVSIGPYVLEGPLDGIWPSGGP